MFKKGDRVRVKYTRILKGYTGMEGDVIDGRPVGPGDALYLVRFVNGREVVFQQRHLEYAKPRTTDARGKGLKYDSGKRQSRLTYEGFPRVLAALGDCMTFGAAKYAAHSWHHVENGIERYTDAAFRHMEARLGGEERDPETGLLHEVHEIWNRMAVLELRLRAASENLQPGRISATEP